jgi:Icc-related predicted phosphoesterase
MKILFLSDVYSYEQYKTVFDKTKPQIVMMGGDLTSNGSACFYDYRDILAIKIPECSEKLLKFLENNKSPLKSKKPEMLEKAIECVNNCYTGYIEVFRGKEKVAWAGSPFILIDMLVSFDETLHDSFHDLWGELIDITNNSPEFRKKVQEHIDGFYESLEYSTNKCDGVYVVKGDHDDNVDNVVPSTYDVKKIDSIFKCHEISGKMARIGELQIIGLGYQETHYLTNLKQIVEEVKRKNIDVVLAHCERSRRLLLSNINSKLVLVGHFGAGISDVNGVKFVASGFPNNYATIDVEGKLIKKISTFFLCGESKTWEECDLLCKVHNLLEMKGKRCNYEKVAKRQIDFVSRNESSQLGISQ